MMSDCSLQCAIGATVEIMKHLYVHTVCTYIHTYVHIMMRPSLPSSHVTLCAVLWCAGFASSKEVLLHNTSEIPMRYTLRVPGDKRPSPPGSSSSQETLPTVGGVQEFVIRPRKGMVPPNCSQVVQLDLTPNQVQEYNEALVVDIKGVGTNIFSLPIHAK